MGAMHRTAGTAEEAEQGSAGSNSGSRPAGSSRRAEDADSVALLAVNVALAFLFKVCHPSCVPVHNPPP